jgi:hypothetical protein
VFIICESDDILSKPINDNGKMAVEIKKTNVVHYECQCPCACCCLESIDTCDVPVPGKICGTVCSLAKANLQKMSSRLWAAQALTRPRNFPASPALFFVAVVVVGQISRVFGFAGLRFAAAMASPPEREVAALESCFRALSAADAVPAVVDCVLASSASSSPSQLFHALLRSFPPSQVV